jgi:hypothetical protein
MVRGGLSKSRKCDLRQDLNLEDLTNDVKLEDEMR